ncbi:MAG: TPM domain-containing protein [Bacteroides sp.]
MKAILSFLLFFLLLSPSLRAQEKVYTVDNLPKVHLQNKQQYVCNPAGILSSEACATIDSLLYALEQQTGIETVVAVVPSIGEADCFDFSHQLLNQWGVGKKGKDNGWVLLLVTDQRCVQFYTGYGLEGDLPDAICKRIQTKYMIPYLRQGDWNNGLVTGVRAVCQRLDGSMVNDDADDKDDTSWGLMGLAILGFIGVASLISLLAVRAASRCPKCGKHELQRSGSTLVSRVNGVKTEDVVYTCRNCGHSVVRRQQTYDENFRGRGGGSAGPIIGGFGGGSFGGGGGGFSGGSFGGGMGGGGGAGSRF